MPETSQALLASAHDDVASVVRDIALAAAKPERLDTTDPSAIVVPAGAQLQVIDPARFDALLDHPRRTSGVVRPATLAALIGYVSFHDGGAETSVWVNDESGQVVAVLNDHAGGGENEPGWGDHRAEFTPRKTPEWIRWTRADGQWLEQEAFAELLEDGLGEIAIPEGAELLEVAQTMSGHTDVQWQSAIRLSSGAIKAEYVEEISAKAGQKGDLEVPTEFTLVLAPFYGEEVVQLNARLRWRLRAGKLTLSFRLDNPHRALDEAIHRMAARLGETFSHVYIGAPRS
jgi:uncharacterized protein YfdQ (DUF2303 family)